MFCFDLEVFQRPGGVEAYATPAPWLPAFVVPAANTSVLGRDALGGVYVSCELAQSHQRCCLHIDTQGHFASLGDTVEQAVALVVALPYWHQLLDECPSGELDAMRALAIRLEHETCEDLPDLPLARQDLRGFLELPSLADPVGRLHELSVAQAALVTVLSPHGWRYESPIARAS